MGVLTVGDHIRNLLGAYCELIDAGDFDGVGALFARGGLAAGPPDAAPFVEGAEAVAAFYASGTKLYDGLPGTKHIVADTVLAEPDGEGMITVRSSYLVLQAVEGVALRPIITGRYVDRFAREVGIANDTDLDQDDQPDTGGWYFVRRHFSVDQAGDLSHHWAGPTG